MGFLVAAAPSPPSSRYLSLFAAAAQDTRHEFLTLFSVYEWLMVAVTAIVFSIFRIAVLVLPVLVCAVTLRVCRELRDTGAHPLRGQPVTAVRRNVEEREF